MLSTETQPRKLRAIAGIALSILLALPLLPRTAAAGCGCDHPPAEWAPVMPYFAPSGATIRIYAQNDPFQVGDAYEVEIDGREVEGGAVEAFSRDYLDVVVPTSARLGPADIRVTRRTRGWFGWYYQTTWVNYDESYFTVLPDFVPVPPTDGVFESLDFEMAVDHNGVALLPLDLTDVKDATQFAFQFKGVGMSFSSNDVIFYSKDGVDLTLFTLSVDESTERQWGSYYGWEVEDDSELTGYRFGNRFARARDLTSSSDVLTYWRHEFHTYDVAHQPGGSHEVDENGLHPDGTLHIEHGKIVLAVRGMKRHWLFPDNPYYETPLQPGKLRVKLNVAIQATVGPIEPSVMVPLIEEAHPVSGSLENAIAEHVASKAAANSAAVAGVSK